MPLCFQSVCHRGTDVTFCHVMLTRYSKDRRQIDTCLWPKFWQFLGRLQIMAALRQTSGGLNATIRVAAYRGKQRSTLRYAQITWQKIHCVQPLKSFTLCGVHLQYRNVSIRNLVSCTGVLLKQDRSVQQSATASMISRKSASSFSFGTAKR